MQMIDSTLLDVERQDSQRPEPGSELEDYKIYGSDDDRAVRIGADLSPNDKTQLQGLLKRYKDIFAWSPADMPGIDTRVSCHRLAIQKGAKPVQQKKRNHGAERQKAIKEEVNKLLQAGFIREVQHTTWLANVVLVKKSSGA